MRCQVNGGHSFIFSVFEDKGEAIDRGNYRDLKLTEHMLKEVERIIEVIIRDVVNIDDTQFGFMPGRKVIFTLHLLTYRNVLWRALRKVGIPEWIVRVVQMYKTARNRVKTNNSYSDVFKVQVGVHQDSVLSLLLLTIVLEASSREFQTGFPWELLYCDNIVIIADTMDKLLYKPDL